MRATYPDSPKPSTSSRNHSQGGHQSSRTGGIAKGSTDATIGEDDIMIDVEGFYSDHREDNHQEPTAGNEWGGTPIKIVDAHIRNQWEWK